MKKSTAKTLIILLTLPVWLPLLMFIVFFIVAGMVTCPPFACIVIVIVAAVMMRSEEVRKALFIIVFVIGSVATLGLLNVAIMGLRDRQDRLL